MATLPAADAEATLAARSSARMTSTVRAPDGSVDPTAKTVASTGPDAAEAFPVGCWAAGASVVGTRTTLSPGCKVVTGIWACFTDTPTSALPGPGTSTPVTDRGVRREPACRSAAACCPTRDDTSAQRTGFNAGSFTTSTCTRSADVTTSPHDTS